MHNSVFLRTTLLRGVIFRFGDLLLATKQHPEIYASDISLGEHDGGTVLVLWSKAQALGILENKFHMEIPGVVRKLVRVHACSVVSDSATPWTIDLQTTLSMGFPRQEYWSGLLFFHSGHLPDLGIKLTSLGSPALAGRFFTTIPPGKP